MRCLLLAPLLASVLGCSQQGAEPMGVVGSRGVGQPGDTSGSVRALYALGEAPMVFGSIPYPDDAYLDSDGRIAVTDIPSSASAAYRRALADGLGELDGFGVRPTVYVRFEGALNPTSLPPDPAASMAAESSVFLLDVDTTSAQPFTRIPVEVRYVEARHELRIAPAYGRPLAPGRRYAAVVTSAVTALDGTKTTRAEQLDRILDDSIVLDDAAEGAARSRYSAVLEALAERGLARGTVVALALFRVQGEDHDLEQARALVHEAALPQVRLTGVRSGAELDPVLGTPPADAVGLDEGAPHDQIRLMVHGRFDSLNLSSPGRDVHGVFEHDDDGAPVSRAAAEQAFTLFVPRHASADTPSPVVVVLHDEGGERSDVAGIANELCGRGYAVAAADAPFHGLRTGFADTRSRFTGADRPDDFGDAQGDFAGFGDDAGELLPGHPFYYRDAVRQAAVDVFSLVRVLTETDFTQLGDPVGALAQTELQTTRVALIGIGLGAEVASLIAPYEPVVDAVVLAFGGGSGVDGWLEAPAARPLATALLQRLGHIYADVDWVADPPIAWPDVDAFRALSDRGSALFGAQRLRRSATNVLVLMARDDERAPNRRTEALAAAFGAHIAAGASQYDPELASDDLASGDAVRANVAIESGDLTRALVVFDPATHEMLQLERGERSFEAPIATPFTARDKPMPVDNPILEALTQIGYFFESLRGCEPQGMAPCSATALVP